MRPLAPGEVVAGVPKGSVVTLPPFSWGRGVA